LTQDEILQKINQCDLEGIIAFYIEIRVSTIGYNWKILHDLDQAMDIVQVAIINLKKAVEEKPNRFLGYKDLTSYWFKINKNLCWTLLKRKQLENEAIEIWKILVDGSTFGPEVDHDFLLIRRLQNGMKSLSKVEQAIVYLRAVGEEKFKPIAKRIYGNEKLWAKVRGIYLKALRKLKEFLESEEIDNEE
jgi:DNA-directed RNA polymerase specialized sigma24 family protein